MTHSIIIFGASARAAASSALRAGLSPWCADLFADADLRRLCPALAVGDYPRAFATIAAQGPPGPWMYTGALENQPRLIAAISRNRELWGNNAAVVRRVRSPFEVAQCLRQAELPCPDVARIPDDVPRGQRWLLKPLASAGGARVTFWDGRGPVDAKFYLQRFVEGAACAAVFVGATEGAQLLGVTRQLVGQPSLHAKPFAYCGSIGPLALSATAKDRFTRLGQTLATAFGLRGLFGVDCILQDDVPWPVEINPRYTASVEVIEHACGIHSLDLHRRAFEEGNIPRPPRTGARQIVGKALLFAKKDLVFPEDGPWVETLHAPIDAVALPRFADIPPAGQQIREGHPILTLFASAATVDACERELLARAAELDGFVGQAASLPERANAAR